MKERERKGWKEGGRKEGKKGRESNGTFLDWIRLKFQNATHEP